MKFIIVFAALFAIAFAAPAEVEIVRLDSDVTAEGYHFDVETSDGARHESQGHIENVGTDHEALNVHGSFSYVGDDGVTYTVNYVADENGFQPQGAHLPVGPEVSDH